MLKFFRKIRQKLLSENKFSKYLIYALGEIILVVIGILIALQINTWNEEQKTNKWEERFLIDLRNELNNDFKQLSSVYNMQMTKGNACRNVLELIKTTKKEDKAIIDSVYAISQKGNTTFFPSTGVYDSGISAGKIENIKNDSLKYAIMNLYNRYYDRLVYNGEVLDEVVGRVDWENKIYFNESTKKIRSWESIGEFNFSAQIRYLMNQNIVYTNIANQNLEQIENVINIITNELNK
jgi:hypothetical protein